MFYWTVEYNTIQEKSRIFLLMWQNVKGRLRAPAVREFTKPSIRLISHIFNKSKWGCLIYTSQHYYATPGGVHPEVARLPVQLLRVGRGPLPQRATHRRHPLLQGPGKASCFHHKYITGDVFGAKFENLELVIRMDNDYLSSIDL